MDAIIDAQAAAAFLAALDPGTDGFCFQTFDDNKARRDRRLARTLHGSLHQHRSELERLNRAGAGVFVTVNAIVPGRERRMENLKAIRAIWQDDDSGWSGSFPLAPSIVVQSSSFPFPKFQRLWVVEGMSAADHQGVMRRLVSDYGSDPGARDLVRVLRVPGFFHQKDPERPQRVELHEATGVVYPASEILRAFSPQAPTLPKPNRVAMPTDVGGVAFERIVRALAHISADDRETWFRVGAALKLELGEAGRPIWDEWSARSEKFDARTQDAVWRSIRRASGVTLGTIYHMARERGFKRGRS